MEEFNVYMPFDEERRKRIIEINKEIEALKKERLMIGQSFRIEKKLPVDTIVFLYYKENWYGEVIENVRLAKVTGWGLWGNNPYMEAQVHMINEKGEVGNEISCFAFENVRMEPIECTLEEARRILKEVKKTVKADKKKAEEIANEKRSKLDPSEYKF